MCSYYPAIDKRGTYITFKKQTCNLCLQSYFNVLIPITQPTKSSTRNILLETRVSTLETRINQLETHVDIITNQIEELISQESLPSNKGKSL